jgi:16S rRNA (guanine527-N7)-methyltransferase
MQTDIIKNWAQANALEITEAQLNALEAYQNHVLTVNQHMNLTAITNETDFAVKHIIDSLTLLPIIKKHFCDSQPVVKSAQLKSLIDIGTGAGFPGLVLHIMCKDLHVTLLDSLRKRVNFLRETADMLNLSGENRGRPNCPRHDWPLGSSGGGSSDALGFHLPPEPKLQCIHARAEDHARTFPKHYDICTARAVASLDKLAAYALPLIKKGGIFLAMKGPNVTEELQKAKPAIKKYGGLIKSIEIVEIAEGIKHSVVVVRKSD